VVVVGVLPEGWGWRFVYCFGRARRLRFEVSVSVMIMCVGWRCQHHHNLQLHVLHQQQHNTNAKLNAMRDLRYNFGFN
jgi:hypothetical protein